jgi:membrane-bound lytic murein transglycosylase F
VNRILTRWSFVAVLLWTANSCDRLKEYPREPSVQFDLDQIRARGYVTALVDNSSISYFIYKGRQMGYEYELLQLLCAELKVDLKVRVVGGIAEAIKMLNKGEGDILAFPLTVTQERAEAVSFTVTQFTTSQVLVQRKPEGYRSMTAEAIEMSLIRNPVQLIDKDVYVMDASSFTERLNNLSEEIGGDINVIEDSAGAATESLIRKVALGEIDYTVTDHAIAMVNAAYYPNLDVETEVSLPQQIAWAVRKNSPQLLEAINTWFGKIKKQATFMVIYNRYFKNVRTSLLRVKSEFSSAGGKEISPFDDLIREGAKALGWDWRLLAAVIYQESKFDPNAVSWAGASGLMQLVPESANRFGVRNVFEPKENIQAGVKFLKYLDGYWEKEGIGNSERLKFVLASYNAGLSHISDARNLARKYGKSPTVWDDNVEYFLLKKSDPKYYRDPVAPSGYCKCEEPVNYIDNVLDMYEVYKLHFPG